MSSWSKTLAAVTSDRMSLCALKNCIHALSHASKPDQPELSKMHGGEKDQELLLRAVE